MSTPFALRAARIADAALLVRIHSEARAAAMPWLPVLHSEAETRAWMIEIVLAQQEVWIGLRLGAPLGFVALSRDWVEQLYVDPVAWRTGLGSALLDHAKLRLPDGFRLWTFQRTAMARAFYRKHGLVEIRTTDGRDNGENEPDVLFGWRLTS